MTQSELLTIANQHINHQILQAKSDHNNTVSLYHDQYKIASIDLNGQVVHYNNCFEVYGSGKHDRILNGAIRNALLYIVVAIKNHQERNYYHGN